MPRNQEELIKSISGAFKETLPQGERILFCQFLQQFFKRTSFDILKPFIEESHQSLLLDVWKTFYTRKKGEIGIHYHQFKLNATSEREGIALTIINDNKPFLVGSLLALLQHLNIRTKLVLHPVLKVRRDSNGHLQELPPLKTLEEDNDFESLIHCHITNLLTSEQVATLKASLPALQEDISLVVEGWDSMREGIHASIKELEAFEATSHPRKTVDEREFLRWLDNHHFTFLGTRDYKVNTHGQDFTIECLSTSGLLKKPSFKREDLFLLQTFSSQENKAFFNQAPILSITKSAYVSPIHRAAALDVITLKRYDNAGHVIGLRQFVGLFTSETYNSNAYDIPLLRNKIENVLQKANLSPQWHDGKTLIHIFNSLPRDELFQASEKDLLATGLRLLSLQECQRLAFFMRLDPLRQYLSCLVYIPHDSFSYELIGRMGDILGNELGCRITLGSTEFGKDVPFARVHYLAHPLLGTLPSAKDKVATLEQKLVHIARPWRNSFRLRLIEQFGDEEGAQLAETYSSAFTRAYQEQTSIEEAVQDITAINKTLISRSLQVRIVPSADTLTTTLVLKLYNYGGPLSLSDVLPLLENMDLKIKDELSFQVHPQENSASVWVYTLTTVTRGGYFLALADIEPHFTELVLRVWNKETSDDSFNRLVLAAGLTWKECHLFRAYAHYLRQLQAPFSMDAIAQTLAKHANITRHLCTLFLRRFTPEGADSKDIILINKRIHAELSHVSNPDEDRIVRRLMNVIGVTVRTNYFQRNTGSREKPYLSFKIHCPQVESIPRPIPLYEIFIDAPHFEAIHLRGGKVARGGIRWSERREDFRSEILSLMKAQMVKNAIIVPVGAKGGFVLKSSPEELTPDQFKELGLSCYQMMIRALLELTDNSIHGKVFYPPLTRCYDEEDPYLVVAADKGTATFSDYANAIAHEVGFWLGDAFASGGSHGYDHKQLGITARGAWESVKRHFYEQNINITQRPITVAGIGDMAGDVFGNGLLMAKTLKLVAAFNHRHIFLDPNPDLLLSYQERQRLFDARLGWDSYNPEVLSAGGAIFSRQAKVLKLGAELKKLLGLTKSTVSPQDVIQAILRLPVDLLWLGGIGTFVKSKAEGHSEVGDRANDGIRINASELRCKVVAEGANLGFTQRGRIEYARNQGAINTDAIDNSAGVDCSDHEVNIKILFQAPVARGRITGDERNRLLQSMASDVCQMVLQDNYEQNLILSLMHRHSPYELDSYQSMIGQLEQLGKLDRELEALPDNQTLQQYKIFRAPLSRPELAILLAYAKISLAEDILNSPLVNEPYFIPLLAAYFPSPIQAHYTGAIADHPLRSQLLSTLITNHIINRMGATFIQKVKDKTGRTTEDIVRCYFAAASLMESESLWAIFKNCQSYINADGLLILYTALMDALYQGCLWLLKQYTCAHAIIEICTNGGEAFKSLSSRLLQYVDDSTREILRAESEGYRSKGVPKEAAMRLACLSLFPLCHDIVTIAQSLDIPVANVARLYFAVDKKFKLGYIRRQATSLASTNQWEKRALKIMVDDFYHIHRHITEKILLYEAAKSVQENNKPTLLFQQWLKAYQAQLAPFEQMLNENPLNPDSRLAFFMLLLRTLKEAINNA